MDRNFYDNDFEEFLKQKSDQYKMYPSDRVWNNIYSSLHGRKKWWALGFTLFFIGAGLIVGKEVLVTDYNKVAKGLNQNTETLIASNTEKNTASSVKPHTSGLQSNMLNKSSNNLQNTQASTTNSVTKQIAGFPQENGSINQAEPITGVETITVIENNLLPSVPSLHKKQLSFSIPQKKLELNEALANKNKKVTEATAPVNQVENAAALREPVKASRWAMQYYASPTVSYRRLSSVSQDGLNNVPVANGLADNVNRYVNHKPAPGFEIGTNLQYKLSNSLTIFAGAQLNYSRYYIDAFKYSKEKASIALTASHDTLSGYTNIRNFSGYEPEELQNKYLQLSIPVGIEIKLLGQKKLQFSVAGGFQPTFLISSTSYLISSDYKNYIQSPDLARGFNVHTNFEAFISYKTGSIKWQIGPQFRSQLLSSYSNQYRVREYLTEYGIKFGVTKSF